MTLTMVSPWSRLVTVIFWGVFPLDDATKMHIDAHAARIGKKRFTDKLLGPTGDYHLITF